MHGSTRGPESTEAGALRGDRRPAPLPPRSARGLVAVVALVVALAALAVASILAGAPTTAADARPAGDAPPVGSDDGERTDAGREPLSDPAALREKAREDGTVRVIAHLDTRFTPEGRLGPSGRSAQRQWIGRVQQRVISRLPGRQEVTGRFRTVPLLAFELRPNAVTALASDRRVRRLEEDVAVPPALAESVPLIGADRLHAAGTTGSGQTVAILDTGVDTAHPFFAGLLASEACYSSNTAESESLCPGGVEESTAPGSGHCDEPFCRHGTLVTGAAVGSGGTMSGVAPDSTYISIQVSSWFDSNHCPGADPCARIFVSDTLKGLERVYGLRDTHEIAAVNMSFAGGQHTEPCDGDPRKPVVDNLRSVGIAAIAASGSDWLTAPACISSVIAVGSTTKADAFAGSPDSAHFLDLLAPGVGISTPDVGGGFATASGTSMAAPHVAGAWALMRQQHPNRGVGEILELLKASSKPILDIGNGITKPRIHVDHLLVTNTNDSGAGSLRQVINDANANALDSNTILIAPWLSGQVNLESALPALSKDVTINGPGADVVTVRRDSGGEYRIFDITPGTSAEISGLRIANGSVADSGGGILNSGALVLDRVAVAGNSANGFGGGIRSLATSSLTVRNSTISGNSAASAGAGGGIDSSGTLVVRNSTVTGNSADGLGSAGGVWASGTATITNSTLAGNSNSNATGASNLRRSLGTVNVRSTIVADPQGGGVNCTGTPTSQGFNIESANSCGFGEPTDQTSTDPQLEPLASNGGPTETMALAETSPAIDRGSAAEGMTEDQRGSVRPVDLPSVANAAGGDGSDVGAFEVQSASYVVTNTNDSGAGSLREAISDSNATPGDEPNLISFAPGVEGQINLQGVLPALSRSVAIEGPGADVLTVRRDSGGDYRIFDVPTGVAAEISGLRVANGSAAVGGGIRTEGALVVDRVAVTGSSADFGGGIASPLGGSSLTVRNSTISGNSAAAHGGGGIQSSGTLVIRNSTITQNSVNSSSGSGGLWAETTATITNSTIAGNSNANASGAANLRRVSGTVNARSTIVADPQGGGVNCTTGTGSITSQGFNLSSDASDCGFTLGSDQISTDPELGPLADNGGPTETMALSASSPAIDQGAAADGMTTDQRGEPRPVDFPEIPNAGDGTDIGAFELQEPLVLTVTNTNDEGAGSLRQAIIDSNSHEGDGRTIDFAPDVTGQIDLQSALPALNRSVVVEGPGADVLTVRRDSGGEYPIFTVNPVSAEISGLRIANGGGRFFPDLRGGGIVNTGTLVLDRVTVTGNTATWGGGIVNFQGASLTVRNSTISHNSAQVSGGIDTQGTLVIRNSTITQNSANSSSGSGGIWAQGPGTITNSTIARNSNTVAAGVANLRHIGFIGLGAMSVRSTIVSDPQVGANCRTQAGESSTIISQGFNLSSDAAENNTCHFGQPTDQTSTDPELGPLADNGGPTETMALPAGSPAIDQGSGNGLTTDQRGFDRTVDFPAIDNADGGDGTDVGAFEHQTPPATFTVTNTNDAGIGSLREAIIDLNSHEGDGDNTIDFAPSVTGQINLASELPALDNDVTIEGPGADVLAVRRAGPANHRILTVASGTSAEISGLRIANGQVTGNGGGIRNEGTLVLDRVAVAGNSATGFGGGIYSEGSGSSLTVRNSTISANSAGSASAGGGIASFGSTLVIRNSTIAQNSANGSSAAGGVWASGTTTIQNSTLARNSNANAAGAANLRRSTGTVNVSSTLVSDPQGGGVNCTGTITSQGHNLSSDASDCGFTQGTDQTLTDPELGPLQDNGGPTETMALPATSPAIDQGIGNGLTTDQRGFNRTVDFPAIDNADGGDGTDVGAFELQPPAAGISPASIDFGSVISGESSATETATLTNTGEGTLNVGEATLAGDDPGEFAIVTDGCEDAALGAGQDCQVEVRFSPTSTGAKEATLEVPHDAAGSPATVALEGEGVVPPPAAGIDLSAAGEDALNPQGAVDPLGNAVFAWRRFDGANWRIQARARSAVGVLSAVQDLSPAGEDALDPRVGIDAGGNAVFAWRRHDGANWRIQARARSAAGALSGVQTLSRVGEDAAQPQVAVTPDGDAVFAWRRHDGEDWRIFARARDAAGALSARQALSQPGQNAGQPQLAVAPDGDAVFAWRRHDGEDWRIQARARSAAGDLSARWTLSRFGEDAARPQVGVDSDGDAVFTWERFDGADWRIQARARSAAGALSGVQTLSRFGQDAAQPQVAVAPDGDAVFAWERFDGANTRIQARARSAAGALSARRNLSPPGQDASQAQVAVAPDGDAVLTWRRFSGLVWRIQARTRSADGDLGGVQNLSQPGRNASEPQVAVDADGDSVVAWRGRDGANWLIQAAGGP